jgi:hypothetical protein
VKAAIIRFLPSGVMSTFPDPFALKGILCSQNHPDSPHTR